MPIEIATLLMVSLLLYAAIGLIAATFYLPKRLKTQDGAVQNATRLVRLIWLPGMVAIWPLLIAATNTKPETSTNSQNPSNHTGDA